jgi:hypothetical protein
MTAYTVVWHKIAEARLAEIWLRAANRQAISDASDEIDCQLRSNPAEIGTSVTSEVFELTVPPLMVLFSFSEMDRMVRILGVDEVHQN